MSLARFLVLGLSFAALAWSGGAQSAEWLRAETKHFVFYSSGRPSELERFAIEAEKFDAMLRVRFSVPEDEIVNRLTVYILPDGKAVSKAKGVPEGMLGGFYQPAVEGSYALSNRDKPQNKYEGSGQEILFHEYTHHFFARHLTSAYPTWLAEGFAEYYSTTTFDKDGAYTVGSPVWGRAYGLVQGQRLPIRTVLFEGLDKLDRRQRDIFYGRSWLLTHKLMSSAEGRQTLGKYLSDLNREIDPQTAATTHFGDLDALDSEVEKLEKSPLPMFTASLPVTFDPHYTAVELDEIQSQLVELQIQRLASPDKGPARDSLRALAAAHPERADILNELAHAEYAVAKAAEDETAELAGLAETEAVIDRVLAANPDHVRANVLKAKVMLERKGVDAVDEDFIAARRFLVKANRADTDDPLPLFEYFQTYAEQGRQPPEIAIDGLAQSFLRAKEVTDFRVSFAFALANEGRFDEAFPLVRYLANDPHGAEFGQAMLQQLTRVKEAREEYDAQVEAFKNRPGELVIIDANEDS